MVDERNDRLRELSELGAERLAHELLHLAETDEGAGQLVERLIAKPPKNAARVRAQLRSLRSARRFFGRREARVFASDLLSVLADVQAAANDAKVGLTLLAEFYESDSVAFEMCDDSDGDVGDVFRNHASALFATLAAQCDDKRWLLDLVLRLVAVDDYGVRDSIVDRSADYLDEQWMRRLIAALSAKANQSSDRYARNSAERLVAVLARQLGDAALFEEVTLGSEASDPSISARVEIATVYLEGGDAKAALSWIERCESDGFMAYERDQLLLAIHRQLGNKEQQAAAAWRCFRRSRTLNTLDALLLDIDESRAQVVDSERQHIVAREKLALTDVAFLLSVEQTEPAIAHLMRHRQQINGDFYPGVLSLAEACEAAARPLAASVLYRALLDSILRRAKSKYYHHGVRYLKYLNALAEKVSDWGEVASHAIYLSMLRDQHARKRAFWSKLAE